MAGLVFTIEAQDKFSPTFQKANNEINKLEKNTNQLKNSNDKLNITMQDLQGGVGGVISKFSSLAPAIGIAVIAIGAMVKGVAKCVKEFAKAEVVQVRFEQTLKSLGLNVFTKQFNDLASAMQSITGISDEVVKDAIQVGLQMGISASDMERTIKVAADLAATFGIDLKTAIEMLAKAQQGQTMQLGRLLPNLKETIESSKSYAEILGTIETRVKGAAEAQGNTLIGSMNKLKQAFGDLKETIGGAFAPVLANLYNWLTKIVQKMNESAKTSLGVSGYEIDKQINDLKAQKLAIQMTTSPVTEQEKKAIEKQIEAIDTQIAILKQQKVANEMQIKLLQEAEKKAQEEQEKIKQEQEKTKTTGAVEQVKELTTFINTGFTNVFKNFLSDLEFNFEQFAQATEEVIIKYKTRGKKESTVEEVEAEATGAYEVAESFNYLAMTSQALGVNLEAGFEGFLISLLQQTQAFQMLSQIFSPLIAMLDAMLVPLLQMLLPPLMSILNIMKPIFDILIVPLYILGAVITNLFTAMGNLATLIYYIVTLQWGKITSIKPAGTTIGDIFHSIENAWAGVESVNTTSLSTTTGAGASYTAAPTYHINVYVETAALVGDNGLDEFAMLIKQKIDMIVARGA